MREAINNFGLDNALDAQAKTVLSPSASGTPSMASRPWSSWGSPIMDPAAPEQRPEVFTRFSARR